MSTVQYNNQYLKPSPKVGIGMTKNRSGNNVGLSTIFTITLEGQFTPMKGGVNENYSETDPSEWLKGNAKKLADLNKLFSVPNQTLSILDNDGALLLSCNPHQIEVDQPSNLMTTLTDYRVTCRTTSLFDGKYASINWNQDAASNYQCTQASDDFNYQSDGEQMVVTRNIKAVGLGYGTSAFTNASGWCTERLNNTSLLAGCFSFLGTLQGTTWSNPVLKETQISKSEIDANYSIQATYDVGKSGLAYSEQWTFIEQAWKDGFASVEATVSIRGFGKTLSERLANAKTKWGGSPSMSVVMSSMWTKLVSNSAFGDISSGSGYKVSNLSSSQNTTGGIDYKCTFHITKSGTAPPCAGLNASSELNAETGDYRISLNGNVPAILGAENTPAVSTLITYAQNQNIIPSNVSSTMTIAMVTKNFVQEGSTFGFSITLMGNINNVSSGSIFVKRELNHSLNSSPISEDIDERITITPAGEYLNAQNYSINGSVLSNIQAARDAIVQSTTLVTDPSSAYFDSQNLPACVQIVEAKTMPDTYKYVINRRWRIVPLTLDGIPSGIPISDIQIRVARNYPVRRTNEIPIPGRMYGALFQNLQTLSNPTINVNLSVTLGFTRANLKTDKYDLDWLYPSSIGGKSTFYPNLNLQTAADAVLKRIIGISDLTIDRFQSDINYGNPLAKIESETDDSDPKSRRYSYSVTYKLVNINYLPTGT